MLTRRKQRDKVSKNFEELKVKEENKYYQIMSELIETNFPVWGLLPKKETEVTSFLTKYPDYDGRGITIAIFDSGVDPGAPGLQQTSEGKVKILERFDCSGCGDVITTTVQQPKDGYLIGLTGRKLKLPIAWQTMNVTNNYRLGVKNAFDIYPEKLRERMRDEHKEKHWDGQHKTALADAHRELAKFDAKLSNNPTELEKLDKEDLEAKIEFLINAEKKYVDVGPTYDCILFHDGTKWMCCVDTSEEGDLEDCPLLGEYSITHEYAPLTHNDQLNFSINVHNNGDILELVGLCSSHGTHVASISSSYFPDDPDRNGIAPGAQLISLMIGDGRLGSMETGTALVRAMIRVMELKDTNPVHVINMSYGEHAHWSNTGRIGDFMNTIVNKYGVIWVASAGNHGPALSTVNTPPDISQETIIGVGAYVSPDMMVAEYSMRQKLPGMPYTWSSRGPTIDGGAGVSICAPGGAITSVPNFTLRNSQLMNGTSMAAPHVAGAVGILLSGLKQQNIPYSPYSVKRALENSAHFMENIETFAQGSGLLQVDRAFDCLLSNYNAIERDVRFHVSCGHASNKGIYLRTKLHSSKYESSVSVEPFFRNNDTIEASVKINFNLKLALVCNASYVSHPKHLDLCNVARVFSVKIDTENLSYGVHATHIVAYDTANIKKGAIFKIPITVVVPEELSTPKYSSIFTSVAFKPNTIQRHFYVVPHFATYGTVRMRMSEPNSVGRFVIHCMQIVPRQSCKCIDFNKHLTVSSNTEISLCFQVRAGLVLEVVVAKYWADLGSGSLNYSVSFYGVKPNQPTIMMHAADGIHSIEVTNLQGEEINPAVSLKNSVQILKPNDAKVSPLTSRDVVPPGRQIYELVLSYSFHLIKATEVSPDSSLLSDVLYESEFESQLWMLFDTNKQLLGCGDAYPAKYSVKLEKGDYVIRLQIRDDKKENLDKLVDIPMLLNQKLNSAVTLDVYSSYSQALIGGKKGGVGQALHSVTIPLYIAPLAADKFAIKANNVAHYLTGQITYCKDEWGKKVDTYPVKYVFYDNTKKPTKPADKEKSKFDEYMENLRDLKISWLSKMDSAETALNMYEEMLKEFPDYILVHTSYLQSLDPMDVKRQLPSFKPDHKINTDVMYKIISVCTAAMKNIDQNELLAYFALKTDTRMDSAKIKTQMERQKNVLLDCLSRQGIALCKLYLYDTNEKEKTTLQEEITVTWRVMLKFIDPNDTKINLSTIVYFAIWHATASKHYGRLLKYLNRLLEEKLSQDVEEKCIEVYEILKWNHLVKHCKRALPHKYPNAYKPF